MTVREVSNKALSVFKPAMKPVTQDKSGIIDANDTVSLSRGASKQHRGDVGAVDIVKSCAGGVAGFMGGALGLTIGTAYACSVVGPCLGAVFTLRYGQNYFNNLVKHFVAPVTLSVQGAKKGYEAGVRAFD